MRRVPSPCLRRVPSPCLQLSADNLTSARHGTGQYTSTLYVVSLPKTRVVLQARAVAAPPQEQLQQAEKPVVKTNGADVEGPIILNGQVGTGCEPLHGVLLLQGFLSKERVHTAWRTQPEARELSTAI